MSKLSVNLNAVAMLRNRRDIGWPSVTGIARIALDAGANGITAHPRPDERHIRRSDVRELAALLRSDYAGAELNIEGYPNEKFLSLVEETKPDQVTFVPDDPAQSTSDHGWDIDNNRTLLKSCIERMKAQNIRVALFIDADPSLPPGAWEVDADRVELFTGPYGASSGTPVGAQNLERLGVTARAALAAGLEINAGHDLTIENLPGFLKVVPNLAEASIGHAITSDALEFGFAEAVRRYRAVLTRAGPKQDMGRNAG